MTPELEAMARAAYAYRTEEGAPPLSRWARWDELDPFSRRREVEAMRAALRMIHEPSAKGLHAAFVAMNETPSGQWKRMKAEGVTPRRLFDVKMAPRWRAMIDHILGERG